MADGVQPGVVPEGYKVLKEGAASVLLRGNDVFYNEAQVTNRDLSTAVLRQFLPILAQEHKEGKYKKQRQQRHQQRKAVNAGQQPSSNQPAAGQQGPASAAGSGALPETDTTEPAQAAQAADDTQAAGVQQQGEGNGAGPSKSGQGKQPSDASHQPSTSGRLATILEGLAASGLRSIRYALEIPGIKRIDANDLDRSVCDSMRANVAFNGPPASQLINVLHSDARLTMMKAPLEYDVIDLDPYGTPSQLLDSAVQSVADGGLLLVTATDMANLCGNNSSACWSNYGSYPLHRAYCHEQALRVILACIEAHANRYKRHIKPLLSVSVDFYVRVFVRVFTSAAAVKDTPCHLAYLWQSSGCDSFWLQPVGQKKDGGTGSGAVKYMPSHGPMVPDMKCPDTGSNYLMGGPFWAAPIHDQAFVAALIKSLDADKSRYAQYARLKGLLSSVADELPDAPLYYNLHDICKTVKLTPFKHEVFKSALINAGYRVSGSHTNPLAVKTDAPPSVIWDIIRCWVKNHPVNIKDENSYAAKILSKEPTLVASFARASAAVRKPDGPRFVENPAYWGPKSRHGRPPVAKPDPAGAPGTSTAVSDPAQQPQQAQGEAAAPKAEPAPDKGTGAEQQAVAAEGEDVVMVEAGTEQEAKRQKVE